MNTDKYIEIYNRFAEIPKRIKTIEQQRDAAEQFADFLIERQSDIELYSAVCTEIEQFCTSGDCSGNEIYDKMRHGIDSLKELTVALEQMNDAESTVTCSDMSSIVAESQRLRVFCSNEMTLEQASGTVESVKEMTDNLKDKIDKLLYKLLFDAIIWREDEEKIDEEIRKASVIDDAFILGLKKLISDAQKKRQDDIDKMLKKHRCLREGGRMYEWHNKYIIKEWDEKYAPERTFKRYKKYVRNIVDGNNATVGIKYLSIGVLLCGIAIYLGFSYWGFKADGFWGLLFIILGSLCFIFLVGCIWHYYYLGHYYYSDFCPSLWEKILFLLYIVFSIGLMILIYYERYIIKSTD